MKELKQTLNTIAEAFELGNVLSFRTDKHQLKGYNVVYFNTVKEKELEYIYKA